MGQASSIGAHLRTKRWRILDCPARQGVPSPLLRLPRWWDGQSSTHSASSDCQSPIGGAHGHKCPMLEPCFEEVVVDVATLVAGRVLQHSIFHMEGQLWSQLLLTAFNTVCSGKDSRRLILAFSLTPLRRGSWTSLSAVELPRVPNGFRIIDQWVKCP